MTSTYPVKAMLTKLKRLVVGISKHLLLIQLLDSKRSERIPFRQFVHELVNAIQHAIPLPMRVLLHQLLPFLPCFEAKDCILPLFNSIPYLKLHNSFPAKGAEEDERGGAP